jgi:hypothetical protein
MNAKTMFGEGKNALFNKVGETLQAHHKERGSLTFIEPESIPVEFVSANVWRFTGQVEFKYYEKVSRSITKIRPGSTAYEMRWVYGNRVSMTELRNTPGLVAFLITSNGGGERFEIREV